jgi:hypothetical protein
MKSHLSDKVSSRMILITFLASSYCSSTELFIFFNIFIQSVNLNDKAVDKQWTVGHATELGAGRHRE